MNVAHGVDTDAVLTLEFDKVQVNDGVWEGTISGDVEGTLTAVLSETRTEGTLLLVDRFEWTIEAGEMSFTGSFTGSLDMVSGVVALQGSITGGYLEGAPLTLAGQLVDPETFRIIGTIRGVLQPISKQPTREPFRRGETNSDGSVDIADAIRIVNQLFGAGPSLPCRDAADVNDDSSVNVADAVFVISYLFEGRDSPPGPFPDCGVDPTADDELEGASFPSC